MTSRNKIDARIAGLQEEMLETQSSFLAKHHKLLEQYKDDLEEIDRKIAGVVEDIPNVMPTTAEVRAQTTPERPRLTAQRA